MSILVIQPHYDDAVFSVGEWMASRAEHITLLTVFGQNRERSAENDAAVRKLGLAGVINLDYMDDAEATEAGESEGARFGGAWSDLTVTTATDWAEIWWPGGAYHHPDHAFVGRAFSLLSERRGLNPFRQFVYEELPYASMEHYSAVHFPRLGVREAPPLGFFTNKMAAVSCYSSQVSLEITRHVQVYESLWKVPA